MKKQIVHCRTCGCDIDREAQIANRDWFKKTTNWYYCKTCWENFSLKRQKAADGSAMKTDEFDDEEEFWFEASYDYLNRDLRLAPNYCKFKGQFNSYLKDGMRPKGIYYTLRYWYEYHTKLPYEQRKERADGGIGIVPLIYNEAVSWWSKKIQEDADICKRIEAQILDSMESKRRTIVIQNKKANGPRKKIDLASIADWEDEE